MSVGRLLRSIYLLYFSQPASDRALFRAICGRSIRSIVELGISLTSRRTPRLLEMACWHAKGEPLRYTAVDLFEARPVDQEAISIKQANAALRLPDVRLQLVPGDPAMGLRRMANSLVGTDLLIVSANQDGESLAAAWPWIPRMLSETSLVFLEENAAKPGEKTWRRLSHADVQRLAAENKPARRAA